MLSWWAWASFRLRVRSWGSTLTVVVMEARMRVASEERSERGGRAVYALPGRSLWHFARHAGAPCAPNCEPFGVRARGIRPQVE